MGIVNGSFCLVRIEATDTTCLSDGSNGVCLRIICRGHHGGLGAAARARADPVSEAVSRPDLLRTWPTLLLYQGALIRTHRDRAGDPSGHRAGHRAGSRKAAGDEGTSSRLSDALRRFACPTGTAVSQGFRTAQFLWTGRMASDVPQRYATRSRAASGLGISPSALPPLIGYRLGLSRPGTSDRPKPAVLARLQSPMNGWFAGDRYWKPGHRVAPSDRCGNHRRSMRPHPSASWHLYAPRAGATERGPPRPAVTRRRHSK